MRDVVARIEPFILTIPRETPYLGALREGEGVNARGYFVRQGNRTVYPTVDRNVLVRITTRNGVVGWGETYGIVAPRATTAIIADLLTDFVIGTDPFDAAVTHDRLYDLMRVRGYTGGYYLDALAAIDIALWDIAAQIAGQPLVKLLGGQRRETIPAYISGLPDPTLPSRIALAATWQAKGFKRVQVRIACRRSGCGCGNRRPPRRAGRTGQDRLRHALGSDRRQAKALIARWSHTGSGLPKRRSTRRTLPDWPRSRQACPRRLRWARSGGRSMMRKRACRAGPVRSFSRKWATRASRNSCGSPTGAGPSSRGHSACHHRHRHLSRRKSPCQRLGTGRDGP